MSDRQRRWTIESGQGRVDKRGVEWFACDPYPYWYRYDENDELIVLGDLHDDENFWADDA